VLYEHHSWAETWGFPTGRASFSGEAPVRSRSGEARVGLRDESRWSRDCKLELNRRPSLSPRLSLNSKGRYQQIRSSRPDSYRSRKTRVYLNRPAGGRHLYLQYSQSRPQPQQAETAECLALGFTRNSAPRAGIPFSGNSNSMFQTTIAAPQIPRHRATRPPLLVNLFGLESKVFVVVVPEMISDPILMPGTIYLLMSLSPCCS